MIDALAKEVTINNGMPGSGRSYESSADYSNDNRPIIGMPILIEQGEQGPHLLADAIGAWAIEYMRGRVFLIPFWPFPPHQHLFESLWPLVQAMDGLLLPAGQVGSNWYRHWQARESEPGHQVWAHCWEIALAQLATYLGMPVLGIGEGAEKWNVALGGSLLPFTEPPKKVLGPATWDRHVIRVRSGSKLAMWIQEALTEQGEKQEHPWELPFMPHQGLERLAPGLRVCAQAEDTMTAAFERSDSAFGLGILARLDWGLDQWWCGVLFKTFLQACRSFASLRTQHTSWESSRETICTTLAERVAASAPLIPLSPSSTGKLHRTGPLGGEKTGNLRSHQPTLEELRALKRQRLKQHSLGNTGALF